MGNILSSMDKKKNEENDSKFKKSDLKKKQNFRKMVKNQKIVIGEPLKNTFTVIINTIIIIIIIIISF